jgi:hypothetical protein
MINKWGYMAYGDQNRTIEKLVILGKKTGILENIINLLVKKGIEYKAGNIAEEN